MNCPVSTCTDTAVQQLYGTVRVTAGVGVNYPVSTCTDPADEQLHSTAQRVGMAGASVRIAPSVHAVTRLVLGQRKS